jgi:hypothetical protein
MTVFTKRNAFVGWATWFVGRKILRRRSGHGRLGKPTIAAALLATAGGVVFFWRRKHHEGVPAEPVGEPS